MEGWWDGWEERKRGREEIRKKGKKEKRKRGKRGKEEIGKKVERKRERMRGRWGGGSGGSGEKKDGLGIGDNKRISRFNLLAFPLPSKKKSIPISPPGSNFPSPFIPPLFIDRCPNRHRMQSFGKEIEMEIGGMGGSGEGLIDSRIIDGQRAILQSLMRKMSSQLRRLFG